MMDDTQLLREIAAAFSAEEDVSPGKWFGRPCLKVGGKVFAALWGSDMVFRLTGDAHSQALQVEGAQLFDPRGTGHPLRQWVQIPARQASTWSHFAQLACRSLAGAAQEEKEAIIAGLQKARRKILDAARLLSRAQQDEVFLGVWSVKDLLAHLAGWDYTNIQAVQEILAGRRPSFWEHYDRDWRSYNAQLVAQYKRDDFAELVAVVEESHRKLIDFLRTVPANEYIKSSKIRSLLRTEAKDEDEHYRQLRKYSKRTGR